MQSSDPFVRATEARPWRKAFTMAGQASLRLLLPAAFGTLATAQCVTTWKPTDTGYGLEGSPYGGTVSQTVRWDPDGVGPQGERVVFGGSFTRLGIYAQNLVTLDPATSTWSTLGGLDDGPIFRLLPLQNGDLLMHYWSLSAAEDKIDRFQGSSRTNIASPAFPVYDIKEMSNGDLVVASGGTVRRFNGTTWSQLGSNLNNTRDLAVRPNGRVVVLDRIQVAPFFQLLEFDGSNWTILPFSGAVAPATNLRCLASGDLIALGGDYSYPTSLVRETPSGWVTLGSVTYETSPGHIRDYTVMPNGEIAMVGLFTAVSGIAASGVAKYDGLAWSGFATGFRNENPCDSVASLADGRLVAVAALASQPLGALRGAWVQEGSAWLSATRGVHSYFAGLLELRSGNLLGLGGDLPNGIGIFDGTHWRPVPLASFYGTVHRMLEARNGAIVVAGADMELGGVYPRNIGIFGGSSWDTMANGLQGPVHAVAELPNGHIVAGGDFASSLSFGPQNAISRFDGSTWHPLGLGLQRSNGSAGRVDDMVVMPNEHLLVAGAFASAGGQPASGVAAYDGTTWRQVGGGIAVSWPHGTWSLELHDSGEITLLDGDGRLWRLTGFGTPAEQWSSIDTSALGSGPSSMVVLPDGDLLVSGPFFVTPFAPAVPFARLDGNTWTTIPAWPVYWAAQPPRLDSIGRSGTVYALGDVYWGSQSTTGWSTFTTDCPASVTSFGAACMGELEVVSRAWIGGTFRSRIYGSPGLPVAALIGFNALTPGVPLNTLVPSSPFCTLDITPDIELFGVASGIVIDFALPMPTDPALVGAELYHQMCVLSLDAQGSLLDVASTSALRLVVGQM